MMKKFLLLAACSFSLTAFAQKVIKTTGTEQLIPEGIAVHDATGKIYVSSINKKAILEVDANGQSKIMELSCGSEFLEGLGMKIDQRRKLLWVVANLWQEKDKKVASTSRLYSYDLTTGKCALRHEVKDTVRRLFNDLIIDAEGKLLITDTYYSAVYAYDPGKGNFSMLVKSPKLDYPNGLVQGKGNRVYIATYRNGLTMLDTKTKELTPLTGFKDSAIAYGLDGLILWNNTLIGIYNLGEDRSKNTVIQYTLSPDGSTITGERYIDRGHAAFHEPTTAALSGNKLYVLANSHLATYNANKQSVTGVEHKLTPVAIVVYELK